MAPVLVHEAVCSARSILVNSWTLKKKKKQPLGKPKNKLWRISFSEVLKNYSNVYAAKAFEFLGGWEGVWRWVTSLTRSLRGN